MQRSKVNLVIILFSFLVIALISTLIIIEVIATHNIYLLLKRISITLIIYLVIIIVLLKYIYSIKKDKIIEVTPNSKNNTVKEIKHNLPDQKITDELKKSASFDHDIVLTLIGAPDNFIKNNEIEFLDILQKYFIFQDLIFRFDENTFGVLIPNADLEEGIQQIEKFDHNFVNSESNSLKFPIMFGLSSRNGRLISGNIILKEAKAALIKAMSDTNFPIIGFRPNPALYREYLSKLKPK